MADEPKRSPSNDRPASAERWRWRLGEISGVGVYIHLSLVIVLAWVALAYLAVGGSAAAGLAMVMAIAVFGVIVLHELGHALVARRLGIETRDITLWPIGGMARMERIPTTPRHELVIALAGPAVNLAIAGVLAVSIAAGGGSLDPTAPIATTGDLGAKLVWINIWLAAFNLVPAFPMDGGRVVRAALAIRLGRTRATAIAARIGQYLAIAFGVVGLFFSPLLVVIAMFVWLAARAEAQLVHIQSAVGNELVVRAMTSDIRQLAATLPVDEASRVALVSQQPLFAVVEYDRVIGAVDRASLIASVAAGRASVPVAAIMRRDPPIVDAHAPIGDVVDRLAGGDGAALVTSGGRPVGIVTLDAVAHLAAMRDAEAAAREHVAR